MAGMGATGAIYITPEMMTNAIAAITTYREAVTPLHTSIENEVTTLTSDSFTGKASTGFVNFYTNKINPATGQSLTGLLDALEQICTSIQSAIPGDDGVDVQLATANNQ